MRVVKRWTWLRVFCITGMLAVAMPGDGWAQQPDNASADPATAQILRELKEQISVLQSTIREMREETNRYRAETQELRSELKGALAQVRPATASSQAEAIPGEAANPRAATEYEGIAKLQEEYDLLNGKVDEQYQTKVESASKYRIRLSGIVLLNLFGNRGAVENQDIPAIAVAPVGPYGGSFGGSLRQSQIGLDVFGPTWHGARIMSNLQFDFAGGFANTGDGVTMGLVRLRTAVLRLDWDRTSIVAGQDTPFFSPLSPSSLATLAQPALVYSGNLWTWTPQLRVERRFATAGGSTVTVQAGILDPLTGERPADQFYRVPQAGEDSRQPAFASRVAWGAANQVRPITFGVGGYYSRQDWGSGRMVDGWAVTADASVPISRRFSFTGEFYRGRAIGGLGGGLGNTVLFYGPTSSTATRLQGLDAIGGWSQLKMRASSTLEFNLAAGQDNPFAQQFRSAVLAGAPYAGTVRNRSLLTNFIYRPRSDLLFSMEYRHIDSVKVAAPARDADQLNLMMGVLF
jgi:hypothetical protein